MADGLETQTPTSTATRTKAAPSEAQQVKALADDLMDKLTPRFTRLKSCVGTVKGGTWVFTLTGPKIFKGDEVVQTLACEAKFVSGTQVQKVFLSFYGWCEANASKLGVTKPGRDNEDQ